MRTTFRAKMRSSRHTKHLMRHVYSLRFRLVLWYLLLLAIILCFFSVTIYLLQQGTLYSEEDNNLQQAIRTLPDLYDPHSGRMTTANVGVYVDMYADMTISVLLNPQGQIVQTAGRPGLSDFYRLPVHFFLSSNSANNQTEVDSSHTRKQDVRFFSTRSAIINQVAPQPWSQYAFETVTITNQQGKLLNFVLVGQHTDIPNQLSRLSNILVIIIPLALLVSSMAGYWLASRATQPIQTITRAAQEIGTTDLHRRLNLKRHDELGELAATFDSMLDRLERAFERQQQFTADASHELRTPLSIVGTEVERILQRPHPYEEYVQAMEIIQQENQRMTRLVNDLLTLARADQGHARLQHEQFDLSEIVIDAVERLASQAQQHAVKLHLSNLDELFVWGDRLYLTQLCINLLENAIKYSSCVGSRVDARLYRQQNQARIQIIDEGPGIAPEHLPYIFERFYRVDQPRTHNQPAGNKSNFAHSGLGLSIAQWIVQEHSGTIQVQSTPGKGSIFEICLPLREVKGS